MSESMNAVASANAKQKIADCTCRPGVQTTEFKGKTGVQFLLVLVMILNRFGVDVQLDDQTALLIIGGLEAAYAFARSILKGFQTRAITDAHGSHTTTVIQSSDTPNGNGTVPQGAVGSSVAKGASS